MKYTGELRFLRTVFGQNSTEKTKLQQKVIDEEGNEKWVDVPTETVKGYISNFGGTQGFTGP